MTAIGGRWLPVGFVLLYLLSPSIQAANLSDFHAVALSPVTESTSAAVTHQLLGSTVEDLARSGARQSITGPIVRGDTRTIEAHLEAIEATYPSDIDVYRILARTVVELALDRGDLDDATLSHFQELLGIRRC